MTREEQLSPQLGRLIDAAKAAAVGAAEGVAVLTATGEVYAGSSPETGSGSHAQGRCAAARALAQVPGAAGENIAAAAVALADCTVETVRPCPLCAQELAGIEPDLPLVVKQLGRWVLVPLSDVV